MFVGWQQEVVVCVRSMSVLGAGRAELALQQTQALPGIGF